ncbi:MAG: hypothetical protein ACPGEF_02460, partial [Endozoicomonas sp.]
QVDLHLYYENPQPFFGLLKEMKWWGLPLNGYSIYSLDFCKQHFSHTTFFMCRLISREIA